MQDHRFSCILFDLDGTLVDTAPDLIGALNHVLAMHDLPGVPDAHIRSHVGHGAIATLKRGFAYHQRVVDDDFLKTCHAPFLDHYIANISATSRPYPGADRLLRAMAEANLRLGVCTNKKEYLSQRLLQELGLAELFHAICGADSVAHHKPHPQHILHTIATAGGIAEQSVMIGDTKTDVDAAQAAGIPVILLSHGYTPIPVETLGADLVIDHFDALPDALAKLS
ncbi:MULTISPECIES: HAD family hydrolase [Cohaesibacter]|uniref:HAD family hydrolase n=1 Tax=Cohaesibacter TaxID=655352 RepID=UPI000DEAC299|nr:MULTISPECIES: HAD family hydrolase [Cohaesibacter]TLP43366.1 phosphoglycolate phosphatase [Cohaesibacter sp. CAU 1516]